MRRSLKEVKPNALEIISAEAIAAQKAAQPKTPPTTVVPQNPAGQAFSWSIDDNKRVLGRVTEGGIPGVVANIEVHGCINYLQAGQTAGYSWQVETEPCAV